MVPIYQLKLGTSKEGNCSRLSLGSYTPTVLVCQLQPNQFLTYRLHSFTLAVLCCGAGYLLLSHRYGSHPAARGQPLGQPPTQCHSVFLNHHYKSGLRSVEFVLWPKALPDFLYYP